MSWQNKAPKARTNSDPKKKERLRARLLIHIKRITAQIEVIAEDSAPSSEPMRLDVRVVLNDLTVEGTGIFSQHPLCPEQRVMVHFQKPQALSVEGCVKWCQRHDATSHVISEQPYSYRAGIQFIFKDETQKSAVLEFYHSLTQT
ncbi:MAG: PilZ domain-containing protein [Bdellovibrionia bacterium]